MSDEEEYDILDDLLGNSVDEGVGNFAEENETLAPLLSEINSILDQGIRHLVRSALLNVDPGFWHIPSSFSGKYHPEDEHGEAGNVLHTKRVVFVAQLLCDAQDRSQDDTDIVTAAAILHDLFKGCKNRGAEQYSYDPLHPYRVDAFIRSLRESEDIETIHVKSTTLMCNEAAVYEILRLVRCSHGKWSTLPETFPNSSLEWIMHFSDYIASKAHLIMAIQNG